MRYTFKPKTNINYNLYKKAISRVPDFGRNVSQNGSKYDD